jgi:flagellar hook-associated protein 1 FlgK
MPGIQDILAIGRRALLAQQIGLQVTGNNIANAQNPDYSRQRVEFNQAPYLDTGMFKFGTGVEVQTIRRMRDEIYDGQFWLENATLGRWEVGQKYAALVEGAFNDLRGTGLSQLLNEFWNAWMELGNHPEDPSMRRNVKMRAEQLASKFHYLDGQLRDIRRQAKQELQSDIQRVNQILKQIAQLNKEISGNSTASYPNNTLLDERDALLDELSKYVDVTIRQNENGTVTVLSSYHVLVDQTMAFEFQIRSENQNGEEQIALLLYNGEEVELEGGKLQGLIDLIQEQIPAFLNQLDQIARNLILEVNKLHEQFYTLDGRTGISFFATDALTAGTIQLSTDIQNDVANIAISKNGQKGDGSGAVDIFKLRDQRVLNDGTSTLNEAFESLVGEIGQFALHMERNAENQANVVHMIENRRSSVMGVNLEEEFVNLIRYQNAFGAASKVIQVVDEMMQTVLAMV